MMKLRIVSAMLLLFIIASCSKKEPVTDPGPGNPVDTTDVCGHEIITKEEVKVGETGIMLPVATKMCITKDMKEVKIELPTDYSFMIDFTDISARPLPLLHATYTCSCTCSQRGTCCHIFYTEDSGLQCSCGDSCTGKFTYKGHSIAKIVLVSCNDLE